MFVEFDRPLVVEEVDVNFGVLLLELLMRHQVLLLTKMVALLIIAPLHHGHRTLMFQSVRLLPPLMVKSGLGNYLIVSELFCPSSCVDMTQNGLLDVWVIEELML